MSHTFRVLRSRQDGRLGYDRAPFWCTPGDGPDSLLGGGACPNSAVRRGRRRNGARNVAPVARASSITAGPAVDVAHVILHGTEGARQSTELAPYIDRIDIALISHRSRSAHLTKWWPPSGDLPLGTCVFKALPIPRCWWRHLEVSALVFWAPDKLSPAILASQRAVQQLPSTCSRSDILPIGAMFD